MPLFGEIRRVLRAGGSFFVFEHNPWNPLTRHAVRRCAFDENAVLVAAPLMRRRLQAAGFPPAPAVFRVFFPRALAPLRPLERRLGWAPAGAQYFVRSVDHAS